MSALAIDRFSPAPGLYVDRSERVTTICGTMEMYGAEATPARAASVETVINGMWTQSFADRTEASCAVHVRHRPDGAAATRVTQIHALAMKGPSCVKQTVRGPLMMLNATEADAFGWTSAHEFGHVLGLDDRYTETLRSKIRGALGKSRSTPAMAGYAANLMAVSGGLLEAVNLVDLRVETAPRGGRADDRVRDWVRAHSRDDLRRLSNQTKIEMIRILIADVVTEADVAAIERICDTVFLRADADAVRVAIDPNEIERRRPREQVLAILVGMRP